MAVDIEKKREKEKRTVTRMIKIYCRGKHGSSEAICPECEELNNYAIHKTENCPFMETKTFCSKCKVHCYSPKMRDKIREVMRYSGPRMLFYMPAEAIRHIFRG